jgi:hypothetical protein
VSLIEEALRKQREETEKARGGLTIQVPPNANVPPPPLPMPAQEEQEEEQEDPAPVRKAVPVLIIAVVVGVVVVAGIVWLLMYGFNSKKNEVTKAPVVEKAKPAVMAEVAAASVETKVATSAPVEVKAPVVISAPVTPAATPVAIEAPVVIGNASATSVAVVAEPAKVVQKVVVVVWPKLTVTGLIGASRGSKSAAIINGQMVSTGAMIEGVRVEAIDRQGVQLSYEGEVRTLAVGGSTD